MRYEVITRPKAGLVFPKIIAVDTEYSELNIRVAQLQSISVAVSPDLTYIIKDFKAVQPFLDNAEIVFAWNMIVDWFILDKHGYTSVKSKWIDAYLMEHLVDERFNHGLGDYALREYNDGYKKEFWKKYKSYAEAPEEEQNEYEKRDAYYTFRAGVKYLGLLRERMELVEHVHRLQWALFDTEIEGVAVDVPLITSTKSEMSRQIEQFLPKLRDEFKDACSVLELSRWKTEISKRKTDKGRLQVKRPVFSFASDAQLRSLIYGELGCPVIEVTKNKAPKTDYDTLLELSKSYPELETLVRYKETKAVYSTFVEGMLDRVSESRIYPHFNVNGTATGRISHSNPNLGNLPREGVIRNFFLPDVGYTLVGADYSQLEVVVEANLTEDKQLLRIINEGVSKHDITAQGLSLTRDKAKTLNFALQYGAGVHKICKLLGVSYRDGTEIYNQYWRLYSGVKTLKDRTCKELTERGEITNIFGRTRHFDKPENEFEKAKQERQAYNFLIQGTGSDMMNRACYNINTFLRIHEQGRLMWTVHDEVLCQVKPELAEESKKHIVRIMEEENQSLGFRYLVKAKAYGPLERWAKT